MKILKILLFPVFAGILILCWPHEPERITVAEAPAREMRGAWMSTVLNIDYPQRPTIDAATLQADFRSQLTRLRRIGINAVFVQVRPTADAIYKSQLAPWSQWLTGRQGVAPESDFDPLAFMIDEAHAQGIEFHAWINPYRVSVNLDTFNFAANHVFHQHRDWVKKYGNRLYLDPGIPQVQNHLMEVVEEILVNYPLNGLHFDDYFYPYPISGEFFPDARTFELYGRRFETKEDWRRDNVNSFVKRVSALVKQKKPWVKFGISPFGVWRNRSRDPGGSDTRAFATSYDDLYGDALAWSREGVVDYIVPQLYWHIGYSVADYAHLLEWWTAKLSPSTKIYIGHAAYKVGNNQELAWHNLEEIPRQIDLNRRNRRISGSLFFSTKSLLTSPVGLGERLGDLYASRRLVPEQPDARGPRPDAPRLGKVKQTEQGPLLVWEVDKSTKEEDLPYYFAIYRSMDTEGRAELIHVTPFGQACRRYHYYDTDIAPENAPFAFYEVRALDRFHRESISEIALP